ncbi:MAG: protein-L-isoaspartate(D-aspartate) O-methyltransferase [Rhodospirillaceae bacterium]|jgi:protein-L-isoaspartate(D-aspartate) O-methyltransferase|nr:protein-L-isoaspartate(D-aspartate) O-methyltransferase [Rhodospirillaceae bacterium]
MMSNSEELELATLRAEMVEVIAFHARIVAAETGKDHLDDRVMAAMANVPRHEFVPEPLRTLAYLNVPLPIGYGKTISQPFIVAIMTDLLEIGETDTVLEVGTGLGYQAAVLCEMADRVYTVEIIAELAEQGRKRLRQLGYRKVEFRIGDGSQGWREHAPYDRIIVTSAPTVIPQTLLGQLKPGGRMVIPVGPENQQYLCLVTKSASGETESNAVLQVSFSPLVVSH